MEWKLRELRGNIERLALAEGQNATPIPYMTVFRHTQKRISFPDTPNSFVYLVVDGTMRLQSASGVVECSPGEFFVSAFYDSISAEAVVAAPESPFLALSVEFDVNDVVAVMLDIDGDLPERLFDENHSSRAEPQESSPLLDAISRLVGMAEKPDELSFMAKHMKREIIFDIIAGPCGKQFIRHIVQLHHTGDIYAVDNWIKQNYKEPFTVEKLAVQSNMSVSSFHQKFKKAVGMGPLQCQKTLRLMEGRRLMLAESRNVTEAALDVGYESLSQFIRDYRRMFGSTPNKDIQEIRERFNKKAQSG